MPIIQLPCVNLENTVYLYAWHCTESIADLLAILQWSETLVQEKQKIYTHAKAWREHLFSRCLLQESQKLLNQQTATIPWQLSLTHCEDFSVVAYSLGNIGIDLERIQAKVWRIAPKFLSDFEKGSMANLSFESQVQQATFLWSIKEALFKAWQEKEVKYSEHFQIELFDATNLPTFTMAKASKTEFPFQKYKVYIEKIFENYALALVAEIPA